jgi:3-oxoacyl-[acyl-carrier protein] reductase
VEHLFAEAKKSFGPVNILVNNAGVYAFAPIEAITEEHFHSQFNLNVLGLLLATQQAVAHMGTSGGSIINISSVVSTLAPPAGSVYSATKAAVDAITMSLAKELGPRHIRVNSINPGPVATEGTTELFNEEMKKHFISQTPLGRIGQPDDIASAAVFLASPDSGWITGETIHLTGGLR